jgi:uncharacterized protein (DUF885 family)
VKRWLAVFALLAVALAAFCVPTLWGTPWSIDHFFTRVFLEFALERPLVLSQLRILEPWGLRSHGDDLDDLSVAFERDEIREVKHNLAVLREYDRRRLSPEQRDSRDVLEWFLTVQAAREPFLFYDYPVNPMNGIQNGLLDFMINVHQINDERDAEDYRVRLTRFGVAFDQVIEGLEERQRIGVVPPAFAIERVRAGIEGLILPPVAEHVLVRHFEEQVRGLGSVSEARQAELIAGVREAVEEVVVPAYRRLDEKLVELAAHAPGTYGVWHLPNGEAYYAWLLRLHTTTALSAEAIHELGKSEVARLHAEIRALLEAQGIPAADLPAALRRVTSDRSLRPAADSEDREAVLRDFRAIVADATARLPELFGRLPRAGVEVEPVPEFMQDGAPGAYYDPPPFDGSRPGVFFVNLRNPDEIAWFRRRTLAHHETVPGHHLQTALAMEQEDLPFFRRILPFTAFTEGWALYAERLADEHGFLPTAWDRLGMLIDQVFRAARLVVDTGLHDKRWSRDRAIAYLEDATGKPRSEVVAEVERYLVNPGQACAYAVGQLRILRLRAIAQARLGERFDLRAFHDELLRRGAMPLELLEPRVGAWIDAQKRK